jgi:hypothetical protein
MFAVGEEIIIEVFPQHFGPFFPGFLGIGGAQPGAHGIFFLKAGMAEQLSGVVIQHQVGMEAVVEADDYGGGHKSNSFV